MNLRTRVEALMDRLRPGRMIVVMPGDGPPVRDLPESRGLVLHVAAGNETDPRDGLTAAQRPLRGDQDQVVLVRYEERGIDDANTEGDPDGDHDAR